MVVSEMTGKLLIVILVIILLIGAAGIPLYVLGEQKTELSDTISELQASIAGLEAERDLNQ